MIRKVGSGGMGEVYLATWNGSNIAVKRMFRDDKALADWMTEVKVLRSLFFLCVCVCVWKKAGCVFSFALFAFF